MFYSRLVLACILTCLLNKRILDLIEIAKYKDTVDCVMRDFIRRVMKQMLTADVNTKLHYCMVPRSVDYTTGF